MCFVLQNLIHVKLDILCDNIALNSSFLADAPATIYTLKYNPSEVVLNNVSFFSKMLGKKRIPRN